MRPDSKAPVILFVGHEATRTGAPIALLHFLRWLKRNSNCRFSILLAAGGDLTPDFAELAETWPVDSCHWCPGGVRSQALTALGLKRWARRNEVIDIGKFAGRYSPDLVYVNSIASARVVDLLRLKVPILTHVHELEHSFRLLASPALSGLMASTCHFVACSHAVEDNLVHGHGVAPNRVETVYESIPVEETRADRMRQDVLQELRVPAGALVVVGGGSHNFRKGADLFVQLARAVCRRRADVYFVWIGGLARELTEVEHDVRLAGLTEKVCVTGVVLKPPDYFAAADVFALTSREDPYPIVCLEAAALGRPIVCFADGGGMPEFVEDDCGFVVPYLDVTAMADAVIALLDSPERRIAMGAAAKRKVTQRHDIGVAAPCVMEIIERTMAEGGVRS